MRPTLPVLAFLAACVDPTTGPGVDPGDVPDAPRCDGLSPGPEGLFLARDAIVSGWRDQCAIAFHAAAGAVGSTLAVRLDTWNADGGARIAVTDLLGAPLAGAEVDPGDAVEVSLPRSGEVFVLVEPLDPDEPSNGYALSVSCVEGCDLEYTRYPIVLFHGAWASDTLGLVEYFHGVPAALAERGYGVEAPGVDAFASTVERGAQWSKHLDDLVAAGVGRRFDVIGHSQGGVDARYVVGAPGQDDRIAAVVTVATPHRGSAVADLSAGLLDLSPLGDDLADAVVDALGAVLGLPDQDAMGALATLNTGAMATFNAETPDAPGVYYASWAGHSCGLLEPSCIADQGGEVVTPLLGPTYTLLSLTDGPNDGMVPVSSAIWGDYRGEIPADHLDEVGQIAGISPTFDHRAFYLSEARRLAALGF